MSERDDQIHLLVSERMKRESSAYSPTVLKVLWARSINNPRIRQKKVQTYFCLEYIWNIFLLMRTVTEKSKVKSQKSKAGAYGAVAFSFQLYAFSSDATLVPSEQLGC